MKHFLLSLLWIVPFMASAQEALKNENKYNAPLKFFMKVWTQDEKAAQEFIQMNRNNQHLKSGPMAVGKIEYANLVVRTNGSSRLLAEELKTQGWQARPITATSLTVCLPINQIETLADMKNVTKVSGMTPWHNNNANARIKTNTDKVLAGTELETPYTGKGVVIGVIDVGLQYDHAAFRVGKDSTRILAAWNLNKSTKPSPITGNAAILAAGYDGENETHGTHVAGIAAGGDLGGLTEYYGMAPDANLVLISTDMEDADYLDGIDLTKQVAAERNAPWVVNMSLGSNFHAHDGTDETSLLCDSILENGGVIVAAAGNEGDVPMHVSDTFEKAGDTLWAVVDSIKSTFLLYSVTNDATSYQMLPYIYNCSTMTLTPINNFQWSSQYRIGGITVTDVDDANGKFSGLMQVPASKFLKDNEFFAVAFVGTKAGQTIDCWTHSSNFIFIKPTSRFMTPDMVKNICSPAQAKSVLAVGAYATANNWKAYSGGTYGYNQAPSIDYVCDFSSRGPTMDTDLLKPDVSGPGQPVISAVNANNETYQNDNYPLLVNRYTFEGKTYSYGVLQGTSMASPAVAGIVALWLQANPDLTHEQVKDIVRTTSIAPPGYTAGEWNADYGYGKIDAYAGIKEALRKADGIRAIQGSTEPLTLFKSDRQWRLLFNSNEAYARISLLGLDGRPIQTRTIRNARMGQEELIDLGNLSAGIYLIHIQTPQSHMTRKVFVR